MELKQIKEMMAAMTRHGTKRLVIRNKEFELELERECQHPEHVQFQHVPMRAAEIPTSLATPTPLIPREEEAPGNYVTSPMVGTFYVTPAPDEPPFAKPGDKVEPGSIVCIIEAMKVMNEVKAGISGTIAEVLVENGHPVEFGTKLFRIV